MSHSSPGETRYRSYRDSDEGLIDRLLRSAFGGKAEADLVKSLRGEGFTSWEAVATHQDRVVGHVFFSPITLERDGKDYLQGWALAPLAVDPEFQRQGIGSQLVRRGLEAARKAFCPVVLVLGDPRFYGRFGFQSELAQSWSNPFGQGPYAMAWTFGNPKTLAFSARVRYARPFEELLPP